MSEVRPVVQVARHLTEIENLYGALMVQAVHKAGAKIDGTSLPGGDAMVALAHVGSPAEWAEMVAAAEFQHLATCQRLDHTRCRYAEHAADEDDAEPPLQTLLFWSEQWREEHGYPIEARPSIASEARFLRWALEWAWDTLPEWDDFAADIARVVTRLENLLLAGERAERGAPCMYEACRGERLARRLVPYSEDGDKMWRYSDWHCPKCKRSWNENEYAQQVTAAHWRTQFEEIGGQTWCSVRYAARRAEIPESTIRAWVTQTKKQERPVDARYPIPTACLPSGRRLGFVCLDAILARRDRPRGRKDAA